MSYTQSFFDNHSLSEFKRCPRRFFLSIICGLQPQGFSDDLSFGLCFHYGVEQFERRKAEGFTHDDAVKSGVLFILEKSQSWRTTSNVKNLFTCIRAFVWYTEQWSSDPAKTVSPWIEHSFKLDLGNAFYTGTIDKIVEYNDELYTADYKTTKNTISSDSMRKFLLSDQITGYIFAGKAITKREVKGCFIDICQVGVTFSRFQRMPVYKTDSHLNEWYSNTLWWIDKIRTTFQSLDVLPEPYALAKQRLDSIPYNSESCFLCSYKGICSAPPGARGLHIEQLKHTPWDTTRSLT